MAELNNTVPPWKKRITLAIGEPILSALKESKLSQKKLIKVRAFSDATIQDIRFSVVPHLKRKPYIVIIHVGTNNISHYSSYENVSRNARSQKFHFEVFPSQSTDALSL